MSLRAVSSARNRARVPSSANEKWGVTLRSFAEGLHGRRCEVAGRPDRDQPNAASSLARAAASAGPVPVAASAIALATPMMKALKASRSSGASRERILTAKPTRPITSAATLAGSAETAGSCLRLRVGGELSDENGRAGGLDLGDVPGDQTTTGVPYAPHRRRGCSADAPPAHWTSVAIHTGRPDAMLELRVSHDTGRAATSEAVAARARDGQTPPPEVFRAHAYTGGPNGTLTLR